MRMKLNSVGLAWVVCGSSQVNNKSMQPCLALRSHDNHALSKLTNDSLQAVHSNDARTTWTHHLNYLIAHSFTETRMTSKMDLRSKTSALLMVMVTSMRTVVKGQRSCSSLHLYTMSIYIVFDFIALYKCVVILNLPVIKDLHFRRI